MSDLTFSQMIEAKVSEYMASGKLEEIIESKIDSCLERVMDDAFSTYRGGFGELIKDAVKKALPGNLDGVLDLAPYTQLVKNQVKDRLSVHFNASAAGLCDGLMDELLVEPPKEIKLSELMHAFVEDRCGLAPGESDGPYIKIKRDSVISDEYWTVEFDEEEPTYGSAKYELWVNGNGRVYGFRLNGQDSSSKTNTPISDFDKRIFQIAAYRIPLILNEDFDPYDFHFEDHY